MKKILAITLIFGCILTSYGQKRKKNPYHTEGTKEYTEVTSKLIGLWNIDSFGKKKDEKMGTLYDKATVEFKAFNDREYGGKAIFRFDIPRSIIDERIAAWNKKDATLAVDSYVVVVTVDYGIHKKGDLVYFESHINQPEIKGSGEQLTNFQATETGFITSQSEMKESGGLGNLAAAKFMKAVTGTDFVPKIPTQVNYKNLTETSVDLVSLQKLYFKLTK